MNKTELARQWLGKLTKLNPASGRGACRGKARLLELVEWAQRHLGAAVVPAPEGFNLGVNDGAAAGQTMPQFHFHVIPRWAGDVADPRGGVRWVIPERAKYW